MASDFEKLDRQFESSLAALLEGTQTLEDVLARLPAENEELRLRLEAALWLHDKRESLDPRPGFVQASKTRLLERIEAEQVASGPLPVSGAAALLEQIKNVLLSPRFAVQFAVLLVV